MANNQDTETLHQNAASYYLQGNFPAALQLWRELLAIDPADHRALEGSRLCEMLSDEGDAMSASLETETAPQSVAAVEPPAPAPGDDLDDLDSLLAGPAGTDVDLPASQGAEGSSLPMSEGGELRLEGLAETAEADSGEGDGAITWDLGPAAETESSGGALPDPSVQSKGIDLGDAAQTDTLRLASEDAAQGAEAEAPAATELGLRVTQLLDEAQAAYESGDREQALGIISRTFILDENNSAAVELQQRIQAETAAASVVDAAPVQFDEDLLGDVPETPQPEPVAEELAPLELAPGPEVDLPDPDRVDPDLADYPSDEEEMAPTPVRSEPTKAQPSGKGAIYWVAIVGVALVILGAGGLTAMKFLGGDTEPAAVAPASVPDVAGPVQPRPEESQAVAAIEPTPTKASAADLERLPVLLAQGRKAAAAGDHALAVIAFGAALEIDPSNLEAEAGVEESGQHYRSKLVVLEKSEEAATAFKAGNYRAALTIIYRLPDADTNPKHQRNIANGWHNLGIGALTAGNCTVALKHFREMQTAVPVDRVAEDLIQLARACRSPDRDVAYARQVLALEFREFED
jgi:tetratricopeptide (TPR) repeat protein